MSRPVAPCKPPGAFRDWPPRLDLRRAGWELTTLLGAGFVLYLLVSNAAENLVSRGIASGFDFLPREAGYDIGESWIEYSARNSYGRALVAGFVNTVYVSTLAIILTTVFGTLLGVARVSTNWLASKLSAGYVQAIRNTPLLLQIIFWMTVMRQLPPPRSALNPIGDVYLTNRGIIHPMPAFDPVYLWVAIAAAAGVIATLGLGAWIRRRRATRGRAPALIWPASALIFGLPIVVWLLGGAPVVIDTPRLTGFNFQGGTTHSPEFLALLIGLVVYTSAFVAEVVRSGIESVDAGQLEAARALGLRRGRVLRLIVLPQALRVIVPPMTSQYVNVLKDSSLGVAIGYPELVSVSNTAINQTGQAIELIAIMITVYITISLAVSLAMNRYNRRIALRQSR